MAKLFRFFMLINQPCRDMTGLLSKSLDGELPFSERFAYKLHLLYCTACRRYLKQLLGLRTALQRVLGALSDAETQPGPGPKLSRQARQRISRILNNS